MAPRNRKNKKEEEDDDPIMYEVDDNSGNDPISKPKKRDKGADLMNNFTKKGGEGGSGCGCDDAADDNMSPQQRKDFNKFHYGSESDSDDGNMSNAAAGMRKRGKKEKGMFTNVKPAHMLLFFLLVGSAAIPALIMVGDLLSPYVSSFIPDLSPLAVKLGMANSPKRRLTTFYEKHNPEKMDEVDKILLKYAGDYPNMIKKLESKYHDYGYFLQWEEDGGIREAQRNARVWIEHNGLVYYNKYVPYPVRRGVNNIYANLMTIWKKAIKQLDKWTDPTKNGAQQKKPSASSKSRRSRRDRNFQNRED